MNYDGLNLAEGELSLGLEFFEGLKEKAKFPFLSANVFLKENNKPVGEEFLIKEFDGFKVGIIGLVSPDFFNQDALIEKNLVIKDPESILKEILPRIRSQTDLVILLSHLGKEGTRKIVKDVPGIDVAIIGHSKGVMSEGELLGKTIIVQNCNKGKSLGILEITLDHNGVIKKYENRVEALTQSTPVDPELLKLIRKFKEKKVASEREKLAEKRKQELREQLKLSPEEFIEKMRRENRLMTPEEFLKMKSKTKKN
jgi:2',3'-cyclic-nucleotide 2'-phosphodiesterase (5'-nucleotidase family)